MSLRIGIVEADPAFRERLENYLSKRKVEIAMSVESFQELAIKATADGQFDMLLVHLNEETAPHFFKYKRLFPNTHLVAHAAESECQWVEKAITEGADAYVMKNGSFKNLQRAIQSVSVGQAWLEPQAARLLIERIREQESGEARERAKGVQAVIQKMDREFDLKARELQVLQGLLNAKSYNEIAENNRISVNTVRHYVKSLYRKMGINTRSALQKMVYQGINS